MVFRKEVSGVPAVVGNNVIEFRADPDAEFTRLYLLLLKAAFENRQSAESHDDNPHARKSGTDRIKKAAN
jgi:hypothetical protein